MYMGGKVDIHTCESLLSSRLEEATGKAGNGKQEQESEWEFAQKAETRRLLVKILLTNISRDKSRLTVHEERNTTMDFEFHLATDCRL